MSKLLFSFCLTLLVFACKTAKVPDLGFKSEDLIVKQVANHVYEHTSFMKTESFGRVACNGMVVVDNNEAIVFDTPTNDTVSLQLINWIQDRLKCKVVAVVATHFHEDCVGGLAAFHQNGIPSFALNKTIGLAKAAGFPVPQKGFEDRMELKIGNQKAIAAFYGEGHTSDNVIGYFPSEKVMFGGCLIKELKAGKGYLGDANVKAWPGTVARIKAEYPDTKLIIPGHGKEGDLALLDYTIQLLRRSELGLAFLKYVCDHY